MWSHADLEVNGGSQLPRQSKGTVNITVQGTGFRKGIDVFLLHEQTVALDLVKWFIAGQASPSRGILVGANVKIDSAKSLTCDVTVKRAKRGKYRVVLAQVVNGKLEVAYDRAWAGKL